MWSSGARDFIMPTLSLWAWSLPHWVLWQDNKASKKIYIPGTLCLVQKKQGKKKTNSPHERMFFSFLIFNSTELLPLPCCLKSLSGQAKQWPGKLKRQSASYWWYLFPARPTPTTPQLSPGYSNSKKIGQSLYEILNQNFYSYKEINDKTNFEKLKYCQ